MYPDGPEFKDGFGGIIISVQDGGSKIDLMTSLKSLRQLTLAHIHCCNAPK